MSNNDNLMFQAGARAVMKEKSRILCEQQLKIDYFI
jgi:hypothetical protein